MHPARPHRKRRRTAATAAFTFSLATAALGAVTPARAAASCEAEIAAAAHRYDVPVAVFYAVGLQETGSRHGLQPFAMNIDGKAVSNASLAEALGSFAAAQSRGAALIDIGCMQINYRYHGKKFPSVAAMFDPARNVDYAAQFLRDLKAREGSWTLAVARYNAGPNNNPAQRKYVCGVIRNMVASGFGAWTPNAAAFCGVDVKLAG